MRQSIVAAAVVALAGVPCEAQQRDTLELVDRGFRATPDSGQSFGSVSPNGREFYSTLHGTDWRQHRIVVSRRDNTGHWSAPVSLPFSGHYNDREPKLTPDGRRLYFSSNRPVGAGDTLRRRDLDLWMAERDSAGVWSAPRHVDAPVNSDAQEFSPVIVGTGTLYFVSTRAGGIRGATAQNLHNVWRAAPTDPSGLHFGTPVNLGNAINTGYETNVFVTADERTMLVSRDDAPGGLGGDDLHVSFFVDGAWEAARALPAPINTKEYEYGPFIPADGKWIYYTGIRNNIAGLHRVPISVIERSRVQRTVQDYLEGFYEGDTAKLIRSLRPELDKAGFWHARDAVGYDGEKMTYAEAITYAREFRAKNRTTPADAPRTIEIFDVLDQTASAKVTAWWGTDYLLLAKFEGRWQILQVLWQGP